MRLTTLAALVTILFACACGGSKNTDGNDGGNHIEFDVGDLASPSDAAADEDDEEPTEDLKKPKTKDLTPPEDDEEDQPDLAVNPPPPDMAQQPASPDLLTTPTPDMTSGACPHVQFNPYSNDKEWTLWNVKGTTPQLAITASLATVVDARTGLEWQRATATNNGNKYDDSDAVTYCDDLVLDGKNDWRLPTLAEALTIVKFDQFPSPTINQSAFPSSEDGPYWTSTMADGLRHYVNLKNGSTSSPSIVYTANARCVRVTCTGAALPNPQYQLVPNGSSLYDDSVLDHYTGLEWRESVARTDYSYLTYDSASKAQQYCASLGGGWRLPTAEEAGTLFKPFTAYDSAKIDSAFGTAGGHYIWAADGRVVSYYNGDIYATLTSSSIYARCVR